MSSRGSTFAPAIICSLVGLVAAFGLGFYPNLHFTEGLTAVFVVIVLSLLEISISFDNAVVNAAILKQMTPLWQHRFLTWGMWIAVFGMRLIFPLLLVSFASWVTPWAALHMAIFEPDRYARVMLSVHHEVVAFGGAFLLLVALQFFLDTHKQVHWLSKIEVPMARMGRLEAVEVGLVLSILLVLSRFVYAHEAAPILSAGIVGIVLFLLVEGLGLYLKVPKSELRNLEKASAGMFIYLEVLDASFSFDGVVGSFAITNNLFLIVIGLGVGAFFVRSLTILLVEKGTLQNFRYLEHGAFYAVGALALIMFVDLIWSVPEIVTGLIGVAVIGLSVVSSYRENRKKRPTA